MVLLRICYDYYHDCEDKNTKISSSTGLVVTGCYLRCHVERGEPILGLDIDAGAVSHEDLDHLALDQSEVSIVVSSPPIRGEYCDQLSTNQR